ncbi:MAG: discoidin domain-containing protein [Spirochaetaceae bacterium]
MFLEQADKLKKEYYVSTTGNDLHPGTQDMPFASINRAKEVIRRQTINGMEYDRDVFIRGGKYYLENTIIFDEEDSGKNGYKIKYKNFTGEQPELIGGRLIDNWEEHSGPIKKAYVGDLRFNSLFENGERQTLARIPNEGYLRVTDKVEDEQQKKIVFDLMEINQFDYSNATIYMWPGDADWNWFSETHIIDDIDWNNSVITFKNETRYPMNKGARYFLQGAYEFLDSPGEFYLDRKTGYLYYWSRNNSLENQEIIAPTIKEIIKLKGSSSCNLVENIEFEGITFTITDSGREHRNPIEHRGVYFEAYELEENRLGVISLENAYNNVFRFCRISNGGYCGVIFNNYAQNNTIYGSLIEDTGYNCIYLLGHNIGTIDVNKENIISNNLIRSGGKTVGHGSGIQINQSGNNIITNNRVYDFPRYCISLKGLQYNRMEGKYIEDIPVTWENHWDFIHSRDNYIAFNDVSGANKDSQDSGPIEAWAAGKGNIIHNNLVHDSGTPMGTGLGIYLDDGASYFSVTNNILYNINNACCMCIKGTNNVIQNNVMVNNLTHQAFSLMELDLVTIKNNIIYNSGDTIYDFANCSYENIKESDDNIFYNSNNNYKFSRIEDVTNLNDWNKTTGFDNNSLISDPLFVNTENGDFKLSENSPAYESGFTDIPVDSIGLKDDFPFSKSELKLGMLNPKEWKFEAFDSWYKNIAKNTIDGNSYTRWTSGKPQLSGQWFLADMGCSQSFNRLELYCDKNYPGKFDIYVSEDKIKWGKLLIEVNFNNGKYEVSFPKVFMRYIKFVITADETSLWWAINNLEIYNTNFQTNTVVNEHFDLGNKNFTRNKWLVTSGFTALDNHTNPHIAGIPSLAVDGLDDTTWEFNGYQLPGQWLVTDIGSDSLIDEIIFVCNEGFPKEYEVYISSENGKWIGPVVSQKGHEGVNTINVPLSEIRYFGIVQTFAFGLERFSISKIEAYRRKL